MLTMLALVAGLSTSSTTPCDAGAILHRVGVAIGGDPSLHAAEVVQRGTTEADGLISRTRETADLKSGRFARDDRGSVRSSMTVFDGRVIWERDWTGGVHIVNGVDATMGAATAAYLRRYGYLHAARDPATIACITSTTPGGGYAEVSIRPYGGRKVSLRVDLASGLIVRTVERTATSTRTVAYGDYRDVNGFALPFFIRTTVGGDTTTFHVQTSSLTKIERASAFAAPPASEHVQMIGGARVTSMPLIVEDGKTLVEAEVRGRRLLFQLDTGGHAILTREAARMLGVRLFGAGASGGGGEGRTALRYSDPQTLQVGRARISGVPFYTIAYGRDFWDRGAGRTPLAGILGLEIFERFAVRLDLRHQVMTLAPLKRFVYRGSARALPLTFEGDTPLVSARADGASGVFQLDTGNSGNTILFGPFVRHHRLATRYPIGIDAAGSGTGGVVHFRTRRIREFALDGSVFENVVTLFVEQRIGAFSSRSEAGNIGYDLLSHFTATFDYRHRAVYLEPADGVMFPAFNRAGLVARRAGERLLVGAVFDRSPAREAGIVPGDRIVRINGRDAATSSVALFRAMTRRAIGSRLDLDVEHRGRQRHIRLRLRELLCPGRATNCSPAVKHMRTRKYP